jgi:hypothetical protein
MKNFNTSIQKTFLTVIMFFITLPTCSGTSGITLSNNSPSEIKIRAYPKIHAITKSLIEQAN